MEIISSKQSFELLFWVLDLVHSTKLLFARLIHTDFQPHLWTLDINSWVFKAERKIWHSTSMVWNINKAKRKWILGRTDKTLFWYNCSTIVSQISISDTSTWERNIRHTQQRKRCNISKVNIKLILWSTDDTLYVLWYKSSKLLF